MSNIRDTIRQLAQGGRQTVSLVCTVDAVDRDARTVDCTPIDESAPILGVNLQANQGSSFGVVAFPKPGSYVVVGFVADGSAGVVLLTDEVESVEAVVGDVRLSADENGVSVRTGDDASLEVTAEGVAARMGESCSVELSSDGVVLNGGGFGGSVKVEELTSRLNAIERDINSLKTAFSGWVPAPQDGGAALAALTADWAGGQLTLTQRSDYENEKVKHG